MAFDANIDPGMVIRPPHGLEIDPKICIKPPHGPEIDRGIIWPPHGRDRWERGNCPRPEHKSPRPLFPHPWRPPIQWDKLFDAPLPKKPDYPIGDFPPPKYYLA